MTARLIDGKAVAATIREAAASHVAEFERRIGRPPGLATVLVGEDPASGIYVRSKNRATAEAGMASFAHNLPDTTSEADLLAARQATSTPTNAVDGILVQLPLPGHARADRGDRDHRSVEGRRRLSSGQRGPLGDGVARTRAVHALRLPLSLKP